MTFPGGSVDKGDVALSGITRTIFDVGGQTAVDRRKMSVFVSPSGLSFPISLAEASEAHPPARSIMTSLSSA